MSRSELRNVAYSTCLWALGQFRFFKTKFRFALRVQRPKKAMLILESRQWWRTQIKTSTAASRRRDHLIQLSSVRTGDYLRRHATRWWFNQVTTCRDRSALATWVRNKAIIPVSRTRHSQRCSMLTTARLNLIQPFQLPHSQTALRISPMKLPMCTRDANLLVMSERDLCSLLMAISWKMARTMRRY